jgi:signal peptidase II
VQDEEGKMRALYLTLAVVFFDQTSKFFVKGFSVPFLGIDVKGMGLGSSINVIGDFLRFTYIENPGMAMGIDFGMKAVLSIFSIVAVIGIFVFLYMMRQERLGFRLSLALILGGAIGNLIDRIFYGVLFGEGTLLHGRVVDFIDVDFFHIDFLGYHLTRFFVFNLADSAVTIGVALLLICYRSFSPGKKEENELPTSDTPSRADI